MNSEDKTISNKDIYQLLQDVVRKNEEIHNQNIGIKKALDTLKEEFERKLEDIKSKNIALQKENQELKERLLNAERKIKKYNVVIYGLKECLNQADEKQHLLNLFQNTLNLSCSEADFRDLYRIGGKNKTLKRPLLVELIRYSLKTDIFKNLTLLKNTGIYITNDLTYEEYQLQKVLRAHLKEVKEQYPEAYIRKNSLIVNGEKFTAEDLRNQSIPIKNYLLSVFEERKTHTAGNVETGGVNNKKRKETPDTIDFAGIKRSARLNSRKNCE